MGSLCPSYLNPAIFQGEAHLHHIPPIFRGESYETNARLIEAVAQDSIVDAVQVWLAAVSGDHRAGDSDSASKHSHRGQPDWDYIVRAEGMGQDARFFKNRIAEDVGNANYVITGYALMMSIGEQLNIPSAAIDSLAEPLLRAGGATYQLREDLVNEKLINSWMKGFRTWYGEEKRDAAVFDYAFEYARLRSLYQRGLITSLHDTFGFAQFNGLTTGAAECWLEFLRVELETKDAYKSQAEPE
jgi:hypothetical protein